MPFLFIICNGIGFRSHADVTTSFFYGKHLTEYTEYLVKCLPQKKGVVTSEQYTASISEQFLHNSLQPNVKKFHLFLRTFTEKTIGIEGIVIKSSNAKVVLEITIDSNLSFTNHVAYL